MSYQSFLIKYGEIGIKGKNRYLFEDALVNQIRFALAPVDGTFRVYKTDGRIFAEAEGAYDYDGAVEALSKVFLENAGNVRQIATQFEAADSGLASSMKG